MLIATNHASSRTQPEAQHCKLQTVKLPYALANDGGKPHINASADGILPHVALPPTLVGASNTVEHKPLFDPATTPTLVRIAADLLADTYWNGKPDTKKTHEQTTAIGLKHMELNCMANVITDITGRTDFTTPSRTLEDDALYAFDDCFVSKRLDAQIAFASRSKAAELSRSIIVDSGCNNPCVKDLHPPTNVRKAKPGEVRDFVGAGDQVYKVTHLGDLELLIKTDRGAKLLVIANCRYCPTMEVNLLPESMLATKGVAGISQPLGSSKRYLAFKDGSRCLLSSVENLFVLPLIDDDEAVIEWKRTGRDRADMAAVLSVQLEASAVPVDPKDLNKQFDIAAALAAPTTVADDDNSTMGGLSQRLWDPHVVLGHPSASALTRTAARMGLTITDQERLALRKFNHASCASCAVSKHHKVHAQKHATPRAYKRGDKVSVDWIPFTDEAIGNKVGAWLWVDRCTQAPYVYPCSSKKEYLNTLQQYLVDSGLNVNGNYSGPKMIQSDRDPVVCPAESRLFYSNVLGCEIQTSAPNVHAQNYVERIWGTMKHKLLASMRAVRAPPKFWGHCLRNVARGMRVTATSTKAQLPLELQFPDRKVNVASEVPFQFGQTGAMTDWKTASLKPAGKPVRFLCKSDLSNSVVVFDPASKRTSETNNFTPANTLVVPWTQSKAHQDKLPDTPDSYEVIVTTELEQPLPPPTYSPFGLSPFGVTSSTPLLTPTVTPILTPVKHTPAAADSSHVDQQPANSTLNADVTQTTHVHTGTSLPIVRGRGWPFLGTASVTPAPSDNQTLNSTTDITSGVSFQVGPHHGKLQGTPHADLHHAAEDDDVGDVDTPQRFSSTNGVPDYTPITNMKRAQLRTYHMELGADTPVGDKRLRGTYIDAIREHRDTLFAAHGVHPAVEQHDHGLHVFDAFDSNAVIDDDGIVDEKLSTIAMHERSQDHSSVPPEIQTALIDVHDPDVLTVDQVKSLFGQCNGLAPTPLTFLLKECCKLGHMDPAHLLSAAQRHDAIEAAKLQQHNYDQAHIHTVLARSMAQAMTLPTWETALLQAHTKEMNKLYEKEVFEMLPITDVPNKRDLIQSFINYTAVMGADGSIAKYKARFLGKGYSQVEDVNYFDTAASTTQDSTWRSIVTLCAAWDFPVLCCDDVEGAFLNADLKEKVFLRFPKDMREYNSDNVEMVARLKKALYGLKQSSRAWQNTLADVFKQLGYRRSKYDTTVFFKMVDKHTGIPVEPLERGTVLDDDDKRPEQDIYENFDPAKHHLHICSTHVDDILHTCSSQAMYDDWRIEMLKHFNLTGDSDANWYLNMVFKRDRDARTVTVSQEALIDNLATRFPFLKTSTGVKTPLPASTVFSREHSPPPGQANRKLQADFRSALGILLYVSVKTRMDISQAVSAASRVMSNPGEQHWKTLMHLLRYTYHTRDRVLKLGGQNCKTTSPFALQAYTDSDWGGDPSRKSTSGGQIQFMGGLVWYKSKLQTTIARSTAQAELAAASMVAAEVVHLRNLLAELHHAQRTPTMIQCDNQGSIKVSHNPTIGPRLKHVDMMDLWVRELCEQGKVYMTYIETTENPADVLTKALGKELFRKHVSNWYNDKYCYG